MAVGDVMLSRTIGERLLAEGPSAPFAALSASLTQADILVGNLECVITERGAPQPKAYVFAAPAAAVQSLALAGFDVVGLANNHSLDYGADGLLDMLPRLSQAGIAVVGAGPDAAAARAPAIIERNGVRVAFLAYVDVPVEGRTGFDTRRWIAGPDMPGLAWADPGEIAADVAAARASADVVVVLLHFGLEGRPQVTAEQETLARGAIDAGAALVLGAHPHVLQPVEQYGGGFIAYSLGNFVFDGFDLPANYTAIFSARLTPRGVDSYDWVPAVVDGGFPRPATPDEARLIRDQLDGGGH
jgi:poly-gamma-glutamate synthesis protein (capsule biosynthesis protein)